jgi:hypothetical protein
MSDPLSTVADTVIPLRLGGSPTVIVKLAVVSDDVVPPSVPLTPRVNVYTPFTVGVPVIVPSELRLSPLGSVPDATEYVRGAVPDAETSDE